MSFANPWGLLALTALPVIAAIHLFHRRYPRLEVAGLHLWGVAQMTHTPGRRRERLLLWWWSWWWFRWWLRWWLWWWLRWRR